MEINDIKERLIELIREYDNKCPECGKVFLGACILGSTETGSYPVYIEVESYPLKCGKCPECAKKCNANFIEYIKKYRKYPCNNENIEIDFADYYEDEDDNLEDYVNRYIDENKQCLKRELDCQIFCDEDYQMNSIANGNPSINGGILIDLLEVLFKELTEKRE
ncbi:MAG: hypothetical protein ACP6IY_20215 [Promethearchaeia archaeon]